VSLSRLKVSIVVRIVILGMMLIYYLVRLFELVVIIVFYLGAGGWGPRLRNDSDVSMSIVFFSCRLVSIIDGLMLLGSMLWCKVCYGLMLSMREVCRKFELWIDSIVLCIICVYVGYDISISVRMVLWVLGLKDVVIIIVRMIGGKVKIRLVRCIRFLLI